MEVALEAVIGPLLRFVPIVFEGNDFDHGYACTVLHPLDYVSCLLR